MHGHVLGIKRKIPFFRCSLTRGKNLVRVLFTESMRDTETKTIWFGIPEPKNCGGGEMPLHETVVGRMRKDMIGLVSFCQ